MLLKFTDKGKFIAQLGGRNKSNGNADTKSVHLATDVFVYPKTNEVFVSDGYGNRRVIVLDADTLAFKRMWGAFGNAPVDWQPIANGFALAGAAGSVATGATGAEANRGGGSGQEARPTDIDGPGPDQFGGVRPNANQFGAMGGPTHSVQISNDGLVYVTDRSIRRVQVFTVDGKYVTQAFVNRTGPSGSSVCSTAFSPDKAQQYLYLADYGNSRIVVMDRKSLQVLYQFGGRGPEAGKFLRIHHIAVDSKGNIYTGEVAPGPRTQKFVFKGFSATLPANALTPQQIDAQEAMPASGADGERSARAGE
jgi:DNA-binding beta-propeller fold protein YncE